MRRVTLLCLLPLAALLSACAGQGVRETPAQTPLQGEIARALYDAILKQATAYRDLTRKKALAACIDWGIGSGGYVDVYFTSAYFEGEYSERASAVTIARLINLALSDCECTRDVAKLDCLCQPVDRNGRNVLTVPELYTWELTARR